MNQRGVLFWFNFREGFNFYMKKKINKLYRSRKERVIFGICGGLGHYFRVDPVLVRIIFILLTFVKGMGILSYLIFALIIPLEPEEKDEEPAKKAQSLLDELVKKT